MKDVKTIERVGQTKKIVAGHTGRVAIHRKNTYGISAVSASCEHWQLLESFVGFKLSQDNTSASYTEKIFMDEETISQFVMFLSTGEK
jgi:hypothetical protein